ncbi:MAG: peptidoglycan bridge formation glycyltransferase FemA/FemB family protein [Candidatus Kerfeldbacteria bacterium]|nr:peptidoglycan bridge formation glycyltransferase FemA/FemB family protein [Candidatus Kerfeldbacteria bacterium]
MHVERCEIQAVWEECVQKFAQPQHTFLQSWAWGEAQKEAGNPIARILVSDERGVAAVMLCVVQDLFFGMRVVLSPRGPLCREGVSTDHVIAAVRSSMIFQDLVAQHRVIALRVEPEEAIAVGKRIKDVEPATTWMIPLAKYTQNTLWKALKQKTRYNIRLAEKHGVRVERVQHEYSIDRILDVWKKMATRTSERHGIAQHPTAYYRSIFSTLKNADMLEVSIAFLRNNPIAITIGVSWGNTATYLYGASDHTQRAIMAPSLLQWMMIDEALSRGFVWYDFYGVAPEGVEDHSLSGVTRFKQSFVGEYRTYPGTYEIPLRPMWYAMYRWIRTLRRFLRQ